MDKLKVGVIGNGEIGKTYAATLHYQVKKVELIAVSSNVENELDFAQRELGVRQVYGNYKELLALNELDAVFIASPPEQHVRHLLDALSANLHVFSESPLSLNVGDGRKVINLADRMRSQTAAVSLIRRHDPSYKYAYDQLMKGVIGKPILVRSQTARTEPATKVAKAYRQNNGGIFLDFNYHDIDLARWYLGEEFEEVYALGGAYKFASYADFDDADYVQSIATLSNQTMANISASRLATQGMTSYTEVIGTEGSLVIGRPSGNNRVEIMDKQGIRKELLETRYERFRDAFHQQIQEFVESILQGKKFHATLEDALEATRVAVAMTKSFLLKKPVSIER